MAEPVNHAQEEIVDQGLSQRLVGISLKVFLRAQQPLHNMPLVDKMNALNAFDAVPARLRRVLVRLLRDYPHVVVRLLEDFPRTIRTIYKGLRAVKLYRAGVPRSDLAANELAPTRRTRIFNERGRCSAVTGFVEARMPLEICHIVPFVLGRDQDRAASPFYRLVELVFPAYSRYVWELSGGDNVHHSGNLVILDPNAHAQLDDGLLLLVPVLAGLTTVMYTVRFAFVQEPWRHTAVIAGVALELRDGDEIRHDVLVCGDGVLHLVMNAFRILGRTYDFGSGLDGRLRDLGPFFA
jgi:hypothetical protein